MPFYVGRVIHPIMKMSFLVTWWFAYLRRPTDYGSDIIKVIIYG